MIANLDPFGSREKSITSVIDIYYTQLFGGNY